MRNARFLIFTLVLVLGLPIIIQAANAAAPAGVPPDQVVWQTAQQIFSAVDNKRAALKQDPQKIYDLVGKILLPHFDFDEASRLVLGRYWRTATAAQRKAFEDAFYKFLVNSYSNGLLNGNFSKRNVKVEPWRGNAGDTRAMIRTEVLRPGAPPVHVDYAMLRTKKGWKAFDVSVEGVSYVLNYRNQFASEIQQHGLDALIKHLNAEASKAPAAKSHG